MNAQLELTCLEGFGNQVFQLHEKLEFFDLTRVDTWMLGKLRKSAVCGGTYTLINPKP